MGVTLTNEMIQGAKDTEKKFGVPAPVTLAQIMLESGGNNPGGLSELAYKHNNLFGIKKGSGWKGETVVYKTKENINGLTVTIPQEFRKYNSIADSIEDHAKVLNQPIYTNKTAKTNNLTDYVKAMGSVYATDPNYANKVLNIIKSNNLEQYSTNGVISGVSNDTKGENQIFSIDGYIEEKKTDLLSKIIQITAIIFLVVLAVIFFIGAFDIKIPTNKI